MISGGGNEAANNDEGNEEDNKHAASGGAPEKSFMKRCGTTFLTELVDTAQISSAMVDPDSHSDQGLKLNQDRASNLSSTEAAPDHRNLAAAFVVSYALTTCFSLRSPQIHTIVSLEKNCHQNVPPPLVGISRLGMYRVFMHLQVVAILICASLASSRWGVTVESEITFNITPRKIARILLCATPDFSDFFSLSSRYDFPHFPVICFTVVCCLWRSSLVVCFVVFFGLFGCFVTCESA